MTTNLGGPEVRPGDRIRVLQMWSTSAFNGTVHTVRDYRENESGNDSLPAYFPTIKTNTGNTFVTRWELAEPEDVKHQAHYVNGGTEPIDLIKSLGLMEAFCAANVIKYVSRYPKKNGLEDLAKARVYLEWLVKEVEKQ